MKTELFIKYLGAYTENDSEIPLSDLGKSLVSYEKLIGELVKICRINGDVVVTATASREGSHIVDTIIHINGALGLIPFDSPEHLIQFLKIAGDDSWLKVAEYFKDLDHIREGMEGYFAKNPMQLAFLSLVIPYLIKKAKEQRRSPIPKDDELPQRIAKELYGLIKKNGFKGLLSPIVNDSVVEIEISPTRDFSRGTTKINEANFEEYLTEDNEILPDFVNGLEVVLDGEITSLKSTRGDSLTFQWIDSGSVYNLELFPSSGKNTKNYVKFYKEKVRIAAVVERVSMYKKPKLHLLEIEKLQFSLDLD